MYSIPETSARSVDNEAPSPPRRRRLRRHTRVALVLSKLAAKIKPTTSVYCFRPCEQTHKETNKHQKTSCVWKNILCVCMFGCIFYKTNHFEPFSIECHPRWFVKCVVLVLIETNVQSHAFALFYGKKNTSSIKYILNFIYFMACFRPRKLTAFCSYSLMRARCGLLAMCELWNSIKLKRQNAQSSRASAASLPLSVAGSFSNNVKARTMKLYSIWSCGV